MCKVSEPISLQNLEVCVLMACTKCLEIKAYNVFVLV